MLRLTLFLFVVVNVISQDAELAPGLVQLTESNIDELVFNDDNTHDWLVMFGAPWCGWCKKLEPEFIRAANEHPVEHFNVKFAKADCTVEKSFNSRFGIEGYPTVKLIRDKIVYNAGQLRNATQIDEYIHRVVTMPVLRYTPDPMPKEFRSDPLFVLVGNHVAMDPTTPVLQRFSKAAWRMLPHFIRCYRDYEDIPIPYIRRVSLGAPDLIYTIADGDQTTVEDYVKFMDDNKRPLVSEVKVENFNELVKTQQPWVVLAINPETQQDALTVFRKAAATKPGGMLFVWINSVQFPEWLKNFGVDGNVPEVFIYDPNMERHWRSTNVSLTSEDDILNFVSDVKEGKIETMGPGRFHPAYLLRQFFQWMTSSFYEYSFSFQFAATAFCFSTTLVIIFYFCIGFITRRKVKKEKKQ